MPSTFSYLPPGTPPWPSTPLPKIPYPNETQGAQQASADASATSKPKRTGRPLLAALVFLVLIPLLGAGVTLGSLYSQGLFPPNTKPLPKVAIPTAGAQANTNGASATPAAGEQLPTPTAFKTTSNADVNISMQYPSDWVVEAPNKTTNYTSIEIHTATGQAVLLDSIVRRFSDSTSSQIPSADALNQAALGSIENQFSASNVQNLTTANTQPTIAGIQWSEADATFTVGNGTKIRMSSFSVQRNKSYYNIFFLMPDLVYNEAMQKDIQPMLNSIKFLS
ncbi:MAG TPA: hypothetical protein VKR06_02535 [Ktedonosporobacter sp.]|nr:hypothetical protein [Ktedonosporobacter sp.]